MPPLGWKKIRPGTGEFLDAEKIELLAQLAMVALLGFLELGEVFVEFLLGEPGGAVDALQLAVVLVALPIGAGDGEQLERLDLGGRRQVRAAAEVDEMRPQRVFGEDVVGALFDELDLHRLVHLAVFFEAGFLFGEAALVLQVLRLEFPHLLLDALQVFGAERLAAVEIVVEAVLHGRSDAQLGVGEQFEHRGGQQVRGGVPVDVQRVGILGGQDLHVASFSRGRARS